jgi:hypothetical protein
LKKASLLPGIYSSAYQGSLSRQKILATSPQNEALSQNIILKNPSPKQLRTGK